MARKINSRLKINGTLEAETPLHVGGYGVDVDTDLPLARNGKGELYIPGTSITGVLRAWCEKNFIKRDEDGKPVIDKSGKYIPIKLVRDLFGFQEGESGQASFVLIEDAIVTLPNGLQTEIRDGVGIDRFYGTAADKSKYDRAILPKGTKLELEMIVEIGEQHDANQNKAIIGHLLSALENEEIRFGASKTRGLGKVKLIDCKIKEEQFNGFENILKFFDSGNSFKSLADWKTEEKIGEFDSKVSKLEIEIVWHPTLPLMNKAGYEGIGVDMLPVTSGVADGKLSLVLAGSSIKGAFRSQAERIVRTLKNLEATGEFNEQVKVPIVRELFGGKKEKNATNPKVGLGALSIDDCYAKDEFSMNTKDWRNVEQGKFDNEATYSQTELHQALKKIDGESNDKTSKRFHISHHTAIDRFTGGVAEGALYSVLAPHNIQWQPITMSLDFGRTGENDKCCLMLLLLVLRDLAENRLPLGFATNRGMGEVEIEKIEIKGSYNIVWKDKKFEFTDDERITVEDEKLKSKIQKEWSEWIENQKQ
jgi:CRISPR/Cas system CSM-associated protein Csm3 (group 7 of RAMP superfamily)